MTTFLITSPEKSGITLADTEDQARAILGITGGHAIDLAGPTLIAGITFTEGDIIEKQPETPALPQ